MVVTNQQILEELQEIKKLLQVIVSDQEQVRIQEINEHDDRIISQLPAHLVQKGGHRHPLFNIVFPNSNPQEPHEEP